MRQTAYAVMIASWSAALAAMTWLYLFTAYLAYETSLFSTLLTLTFPVVAQVYWVFTSFFQHGIRHILVFGFIILVVLVGLSAVLFAVARAPSSRWGRTLVTAYVGIYWLRQIALGIWSWSLMSTPEWWANFGMSLVLGLGWPIIWPGGFLLGVLSVAMR